MPEPVSHIAVLLDPEAEEVSISAPGATVILTGAEQVRQVRDRLSQHLITMAESEDPPPGPGLTQGWHSYYVPGPGAPGGG